MIHKKGAKTVLWGCSINENILNDINVIKDLKLYNLIVVRESLTYNALRKAGITENVVLYPDPAFQLDKEELQLPEGFMEGNTIGINIKNINTIILIILFGHLPIFFPANNAFSLYDGIKLFKCFLILFSFF